MSTETVTTDRFQLALENVAAEAAALKPEEFVTINVDIPTAVTTVRGALPEIRAQRAAIAEQLPKFDLKQFDKLETYTLAVAQAHAAWFGSTTPVSNLVALNDQATTMRELLVSDATALGKRGLVDGARVAELKNGAGYRGVAFDIIGLTTMLRDAWPTIAGKTALSTREIEDARRVADQLLDAVGVRDQAPVVSAATSDARARAYTLFFNAYDEARAAIHYLRRHIGDAEKIAPSLYAGRGGRGKKEEPAQRPPAKPSEHVSPIDATQPVATVPHTMPQAADASDDGPFVHN